MRLALALGACLISSSLLAAPSEVATAKAGLVPLTDLAKRAEISDISLSPDGKTLAVLAPQGDYGTVMVFIDTETMKATAGFNDKGERVPGNIVWANNDRVILALVKKFGGFATPFRTGELVGADRTGKSVVQLFGNTGVMQTGTMLKTRATDTGAAEVVDGLVDDPKFALIAVNAFSSEGSFTELHRMNEATGAHNRIARVPIRDGQFLLDHNHEPRFAIGLDVDGVLKVFRRDGSDWTLVFDSLPANAELVPIAFARDNKSFYAYWIEYKKPAVLVRVDAQTLVRTVLFQPKFASPTGVIYTADRKAIYAVRTQDGLSGIEIIDESAPEAKTWRAFSKQFPGSLVEPVSYSRDGQKALFSVSNSVNSGDYYIFDLEKRSAKYLFPVHSWLDPEEMSAVQAIQLKARDGLVLHGFLTVPRGVAPKNMPLVVMPHGGPHTVRDDDRFDPWVQVLASRGYAVLKVDFRGSAGYNYAFKKSGYRQWGRAMQDDLTDATRWAIESGYADPKRIAIAGASYGGYAALMGVAREPKLYRAAISYVGLSDLEMMYTRGDTEDSSFGVNFLKRAIGNDKAELKARSPVNLAGQIEAPTLIIHGGQDSTVPVQHGRNMRDALKAAGKTVEYFEVADEMHGFYKQKNIVESYTRMLAFLDKHLAVEASAKP